MGTYRNTYNDEMSCSDSEDSFIEFTTEEGPSNMDTHSSSSTDEMSWSDSEDSLIEFTTEAGPSNPRRSAQISIIELMDQDNSSDDDDDDWKPQTMVFHHTNLNRNNSVSDSEDSFIFFDGENQDEDMDEEIECNNTFTVAVDLNFEENKTEKKSRGGKKVTFAEGSNLCTVHKMIKWSFAYQNARKGLWEQYGRDHERFKFRISRFGNELNRYLLPEHRQKIYDERFRERQY